MMMIRDDTIAAIATPAGRGGIGIVRLSGADAWEIASQALRRAARNETIAEPAHWMAPGRVRLAEIFDESGQAIDQALVTAFRKPHSYTAEDLVEIACHGSPVVLRYVLERCLVSGARLAEPGEFTMRAFLNGRIDLTQAEAVRDLIEARTLFQAKVAAQQVEGSVAQWIAPVKRELTELIAYLEAGIDFAEDDVSVLPAEEIGARIEKIDGPLARLLESFTAGRIIHDGLTLALIGRPNVGKSSLFNRLLEQDRAIVTAAPGTTRDLVAETIEIDGIPLRFVDTAGIREAFEEAEAIGIRKSLAAAADSDLTLLILDGAAEQTAEDWSLFRRVADTGKWIAVVNKCDLPLRVTREQILREISSAASEQSSEAVTVQYVSALTGTGMPELRQAILGHAAPALAGERETQVLTSLRQQQLISAARDSLRAAKEASKNTVPHEMMLLDLYSSLRHLDALTGATTTEDILTTIFSSFCIGK